MMKRTRKSKIPPLIISESHRARIPGMYVAFLSFLTYESDHFRVSFFSDDCEPYPSRPHSPDEDEGTETERIDFDDPEGGNFNEGEEAEEEYDGWFWGGN